MGLRVVVQDHQGDPQLAVHAAEVVSFANYVSAWDTAGIGTSFFNTIVVVGCSLVLVMVLGAMCAYVLARFQFFGNRAIYYLMLAGLTFPVFLAIVPLFFILRSLGLLNTLQGLILSTSRSRCRSRCSSCSRSSRRCRTRSTRRRSWTGRGSGGRSSR